MYALKVGTLHFGNMRLPPGRSFQEVVYLGYSNGGIYTRIISDGSVTDIRGDLARTNRYFGTITQV